jgi:LuxR family maltose regulon positive regulatory protein
LQKIDNDIGINKLAVLQDDTHLLIPLANELVALETNFILVLDDYHNIAESEIHEVLDFLFDLVPLYWQQLTSLEMEFGNEKIV